MSRISEVGWLLRRAPPDPRSSLRGGRGLIGIPRTIARATRVPPAQPTPVPPTRNSKYAYDHKRHQARPDVDRPLEPVRVPRRHRAIRKKRYVCDEEHHRGKSRNQRVIPTAESSQTNRDAEAKSEYQHPSRVTLIEAGAGKDELRRQFAYCREGGKRDKESSNNGSRNATLQEPSPRSLSSGYIGEVPPHARLGHSALSYVPQRELCGRGASSRAVVAPANSPGGVVRRDDVEPDG